MKIIAWLFGKDRPSLDNEPASPPPLTINFGAMSHEISDEEVAAISAERQRKSKEWSALSKEEKARRKAEQKKQFVAARREQGIADRARKKELGITHFQWIWVDAGHDCAACKSKDGKIFPYDGPPNGIYPGDGDCCPDENCKCVTRSVVPGWED